MRWVWLRHGETEDNARRCYLGQCDSPLTAKGYEQVSVAVDWLVSNLLEDFKGTRLYTSDLGRCVETATIVGRALGLQPKLDTRLRELDFGQWDGRTYEDIMSSGDREWLERWYDNPADVAPPDGETLSQLGQRVDQWVEQTIVSLESANNDTIVIVTHGGPIRWFQSRWARGEGESGFWQGASLPPGGILVAEWDGRQFTLISESR